MQLYFPFLSSHTVMCQDLQSVSNGFITYTPLSDEISFYLHYIGTIAIYSCSPGYQLMGGSSQRVCGLNGTWNGTEPSCGEKHVYAKTS